jgi:hypothetical protein
MTADAAPSVFLFSRKAPPLRRLPAGSFASSA